MNRLQVKLLDLPTWKTNWFFWRKNIICFVNDLTAEPLLRQMQNHVNSTGYRKAQTRQRWMYYCSRNKNDLFTLQHCYPVVVGIAYKRNTEGNTKKNNKKASPFNITLLRIFHCTVKYYPSRKSLSYIALFHVNHCWKFCLEQAKESILGLSYILNHLQSLI